MQGTQKIAILVGCVKNTLIDLVNIFNQLSFLTSWPCLKKLANSSTNKQNIYVKSRHMHKWNLERRKLHVWSPD